MAITSKSDLLYGWDASLGVWTGPGEQTFTRDGKRYYFARDGLYRPVYDDVARHPYPDVADHRARMSELALGDTPVTDDSVRFDSASAWARESLGSEASASSVIASLPTNGEARQLVGSGAGGGRLLQTNTFGGGKETCYGVFEDDGSGGIARVLLRDSTAGSNIADASYDFSTSSFTESVGDAGFVVLDESGPNGGEVVLLWATGPTTNGNSARFYPYFDGDGSGKGAIFHYAAHSALSFPPGINPYVGSPSATPGEQFSVSPGPYRSDVVQVGYVAFIPATLFGDTGSFLHIISHGDGTDPRVILNERADRAGGLNLNFRDASANTDLKLVDIGTSDRLQYVEAVYVFDPSDGNTRLLARSDGGTWQDSGTGSPSSWTPPTSLGANNQVAYNETGALNGTNRGRQFFHRHLIALANSLDNDPFTGGASAVGDEMAAVQPTTIKE